MGGGVAIILVIVILVVAGSLGFVFLGGSSSLYVRKMKRHDGEERGDGTQPLHTVARGKHFASTPDQPAPPSRDT